MSDGTGQLIAGDGARRWITPAIETIIAAIVVALILVALACAGQSYETNWILIAILPVAFWLFFSGRISTFKAFGVELQAVIRQASVETIRDRDLILHGSQELTLIKPRQKADVGRIEQYVQQRLPALSFDLRRKNYYTAYAIQQYLNALSRHGFFKWVVFRDHNNGGRFAGLIPARNLQMLGGNYGALQSLVEQGEVEDLPGFIGPEFALRLTTTKGHAIERFADTDFDDLPVVDPQGRFVGVLNRGKLQSRLLASILNAARAHP